MPKKREPPFCAKTVVFCVNSSCWRLTPENNPCRLHGMHAWRRDNDHRTHSWLHIQRARVHESGRHRHGVHRQTALISVSVWLKILIRILVTRGHYGCSLHRHHGHLRGGRVDDHRGCLRTGYRRSSDLDRVSVAGMDHARSENLRGKLGGQSQNQKKASKPFHGG